MVAFTLSLLITVVLVAGIVVYSRRRPADAPATWGENMAGAFIVFFLLFWVYGVVPHQWLTWADNELQWRADRTFVGPGEILAPQSQDGWMPFTITYVVLRDLIAVAIYGIALGGNIWLWSLWQKRGDAQAIEKAPERSTFGRPILKEGTSS